MKLLVCGEARRIEEFQKLPLQGVEADFLPDPVYLDEVELHQYDAIFDLSLDDEMERLHHYAELKNMPVIGCAVKASLAEMVYFLEEPLECVLIGINAMPGMLNRSLLEVSLYSKAGEGTLERVFSALGLPYRLVQDRVGMVTPRILFMIINEACYTLQEDTADKRDIDESMRLGVNYPKGPFQWLNEIGVGEVYETLERIYDDTKEERYKICPWLKTQYLHAQGRVCY